MGEYDGLRMPGRGLKKKFADWKKGATHLQQHNNVEGRVISLPAIWRDLKGENKEERKSRKELAG